MKTTVRSNHNWLERLETERDHLCRGGVESVSDVGLISLLDSEYRDEVATALAKSVSPWLTTGRCFAIGYMHALTGERADATGWMLRAQALIPRRGSPLVARLAVELGNLYLASLQPASAEATLTWASGRIKGRTNAELLHLQALIAQTSGDYATAASLFRQTIRTRASLSAVTRVEATINLAVAIEHSTPEEALQLCDLARSTIAAHKLHRRYEAAVENIASYCLVLVGNVDAARTSSLRALALATECGANRVAQFARFNHALIEEIGGGERRADEMFRDLRNAAAVFGMSELVVWCDLRLAWRELSRGNSAAASRAADAIPLNLAFKDSILMLRGLIAVYDGRLSSARLLLDGVRRTAQQRNDVVMHVVTQLWLAIVQRRSGKFAQSTALLRAASREASAAGLRASTVWWSSSLIRELAATADPDARTWLDAVVIPSERKPRISVDGRGRVLIDDTPLPERRWRLGRTGSRVLQRLCAALVARYPGTMSRDELTDRLWPESDGAAAVSNLYAATNDLRKILEPFGMRVSVLAGRYGLEVPRSITRDHLTATA